MPSHRSKILWSPKKLITRVSLTRSPIELQKRKEKNQNINPQLKFIMWLFEGKPTDVLCTQLSDQNLDALNFINQRAKGIAKFHSNENYIPGFIWMDPTLDHPDKL